MMMRFYGYFILVILVSKSAGVDEEEIPQSLNRRANFRKRFQLSDPEADLRKRFQSSDPEAGLRKRFQSSDPEADLRKRFQSSDLEADLLKRFQSSDPETGLRKRFQSSVLEADLRKRFQSSDLEADLLKRFQSSDPEAGLRKRFHSSDPEEDLRKRFESSDPEEDLRKRFESSDPEEDLRKRFESSDPEEDLRKRFESSDSEEDLLTSLLSEAKRDSSQEDTETDDSAPTDIQDPVRIAIFNAGEYDAHIKLNYVLNGQQAEDEILSNIKPGQHRSLFVPAGATYVRVRVNQSDHHHDKVIIDEQIDDFTDSTGYCYLLAHDGSHPVYGLCSSTYRDMLESWGISK